MYKLFVIFFISFCSVGVVLAQQPMHRDFKICLSIHLKAIEKRNLSDIAATISDSVTLIFPDGEVIESKEKFVAFHKEWFGDPGWKMSPTILKVVEKGQLSYAFLKYRLITTNADGSTKSQSDTYLLLIFEKQNGEWKLIHDQNTRIVTSQ